MSRGATITGGGDISNSVAGNRYVKSKRHVSRMRETWAVMKARRRRHVMAASFVEFVLLLSCQYDDDRA